MITNKNICKIICEKHANVCKNNSLFLSYFFIINLLAHYLWHLLIYHLRHLLIKYLSHLLMYTESSTIRVKYLLFSQIHVLGFQLQFFFARAILFTLALTCIIITFLIWITCYAIEFAFTIHEICFTNVLALYIPVIIIHTLTFTSFVLLGTHIFVYKSSKTLQLSLHLSRLTMNGLFYIILNH